MNRDHFNLIAVEPLDGYRLALTYADGAQFTVGLESIIRRHRLLAPLLDATIFNTATLDEWAMGVCWNSDENLTLASDNLRAWAIEQSGEASHETLLNWMHQHGLTLDAAASALGLSRRMLAYYRSGEKPVPRTVALAMLGWEVEQAA